MANSKTIKIIGWILTGLVALANIVAGIAKNAGLEEIAQNSVAWGLNPSIISILGIIQIACAILLLIPRTGIIGTLLLAAYFGGAIATHLEHGQSVLVPVVFEALIWIGAFLRFPELRQRMFNQLK